MTKGLAMVVILALQAAPAAASPPPLTVLIPTSPPTIAIPAPSAGAIAHTTPLAVERHAPAPRAHLVTSVAVYGVAMGGLAWAYTADENQNSGRENTRLLGVAVGGAGAPIIHAVWRQEDLAVIGTVSRCLLMGVGWLIGQANDGCGDRYGCNRHRGRELGLAAGLTMATALDLTILFAR